MIVDLSNMTVVTVQRAPKTQNSAFITSLKKNKVRILTFAFERRVAAALSRAPNGRLQTTSAIFACAARGCYGPADSYGTGDARWNGGGGGGGRGRRHRATDDALGHVPIVRIAVTTVTRRRSCVRCCLCVRGPFVPCTRTPRSHRRCVYEYRAVHFAVPLSVGTAIAYNGVSVRPA